MKHCDESELIEMHYMSGIDSAAVRHVESCPDCAERFRSVQNLLGAAAASANDVEGLPETFWVRQRHAIERKIATARPARPRRWRIPALAAIAAGAVLVVISAMLLQVRGAREIAPQKPALSASRVQPQRSDSTIDSAEDVVEDLQARHDPWNSDQLRDFHSVVEWESWVPSTSASGGTL